MLQSTPAISVLWYSIGRFDQPQFAIQDSRIRLS